MMTLRELLENIERIKLLQHLRDCDSVQWNGQLEWELNYLLAKELQEVEYSED